MIAIFSAVECLAATTVSEGLEKKICTYVLDNYP